MSVSLFLSCRPSAVLLLLQLNDQMIGGIPQIQRNSSLASLLILPSDRVFFERCQGGGYLILRFSPACEVALYQSTHFDGFLCPSQTDQKRSHAAEHRECNAFVSNSRREIQGFLKIAAGRLHVLQGQLRFAEPGQGVD